MKSLFTFFTFLFFYQIAFAQQPCSPTIYSYPRDYFSIHGHSLTADGGAIICGNKIIDRDDSDAYLLKVDAFGNVMWEQVYGDTLMEDAKVVQQTDDGGYIVIGTKEIIKGRFNFERIRLFKTDPFGILEWERIIDFDNFSSYSGEDVKVLPNGDFMIIGTETAWGYSNWGDFQYDKMIIQRLDNMGNEIKTIYVNPMSVDWNDDPVEGNTQGISVNLVSDGGFVFTGSTGPSGFVYPREYEAFAVKTDADLNVEWENVFSDGGICHPGQLMNVIELDGYYYGAIFGQTQCLDSYGRSKMVKINLSGNEMWAKTFFAKSARKVIATNDNQLAISFTNTLMKFDTSGTLIWESNEFPMTTGNKNSLYQNADNGFVLSGYKANYRDTNEVILLITDSLGNNCNNYIEGYVFQDEDGDCVLDSTENLLRDLVVEVQPGSITQLTNSSGFYRIPVDTGNYTVTVSGLNNLWEQTCTTSYQVSFDSIYQTKDSIDFAFDALVDCHLMNITATVNRARVCLDNSIVISYCNDGTIDAQDVYIDLILSEDLSLTSSPIPYFQAGNVYTFEVGDVPSRTCRTLNLNTFVSCDAILGDTICVDVSITPAEDCGSLLSNGSSKSCLELTNSFDPNDKQVILDQDEDCLTEDTDLLTYHIRFQNTGNDTAYRVVITDQISEKLDISTIQTIGNSHAYDWEIWNNNTIIWTFDDVDLVDSAKSQINSQGFIQFKIAPKEAIDINTIIENEAKIYFDFNEPIVTNNVVLYHCDFAPFQNVLVSKSDPSDCYLKDGIIEVEIEETFVDVEYSIDGGNSWQAQSRFLDLAPGEYNIVLRDNSGQYISEYENNPVLIEALLPPQINEVQTSNPSAGSTSDGLITVLADGDQPLRYSIDGGLSWQISNTFTGLSEGDYQILIQYENETCQITTDIITLSKTVATHQANSIFDIRIVPNPATENILVTVTNPPKKLFTMSILDSTGKLVLEKELGNQINTGFEVDISLLTSGVYFIRINNETAFHYEKLIVY